LGTRLKVGVAPGLIWVADKLKDFLDWIERVGAGIGGVIAGDQGLSQEEINDINSKQLEIAKRQLKEGKITPDRFQELTSGMNSLQGSGVNRWEDFKKAYDQEKSNQATRDAANAAAKAAASEARTKRENSAPQFDPLAISPKAEKTSADSLVKVGNFLGQAPGAVNSIAERQLAISRQQLDQGKEMIVYLKQLAERNQSQSSTISVPAT
jgi:hypothetical protein